MIHISAPCIYTRVLENLELRENLSFLNIGSGTGYFSSMVGLMLGPFGVNHNIELHKELIDYARQKTIEFVDTAAHFDHFDYCVPKFVNGNVMNLIVNSDTMLYDRIYVGAGVTDAEEEFLTKLLKVDGILVMPLNDSLVKIKRVDEDTFTKKSIMTVSFASLVTHNASNNELFSMPRLNPLSLQEICRYKIREQIRAAIHSEYKDYYSVHREKSTFNQNRSEKETDPVDEEEKSSDEDEEDSEDNNESNDDLPLSRFSRLFTQRNSDVNLNLENQLRLMIYGQILDAAVSQPQTTTNTSSRQNQTNETESETEETNNNADDDNIVDDEPIMNSEQLISTATALMEVTESVERQAELEKARSIVGIPISKTNESEMLEEEEKEKNLASSIESIEEDDENLNEFNSKRENDSSSGLSSSSASNSNMLAIACDKRAIINARRKRQVSSGYQSTSTDFSSSLNESACLKLSSDESKKIESEDEEINEANRNDEHYFDDDNDDDDYNHPVVLHSSNSETNLNKDNNKEALKPISIDHILKASISGSSSCSDSKSYLKRNLLREKVMQLPVSESLKQFLLYYRKI